MWYVSMCRSLSAERENPRLQAKHQNVLSGDAFEEGEGLFEGCFGHWDCDADLGPIETEREAVRRPPLSLENGFHSGSLSESSSSCKTDSVVDFGAGLSALNICVPKFRSSAEAYTVLAGDSEETIIIGPSEDIGAAFNIEAFANSRSLPARL